MRMSIVRACSAVAVTCLLSACDGLSTFKTTLGPNRLAQDCNSASKDNSGAIYCDAGDVYGLACTAPDGQVISQGQLLDLGVKPPQVGFLHSHEPGTSPANCWRYGSWVTRAYVNFNLALAVPKIVSVVVARLHWKPTTKVHASSPPSDQPPHCYGALYEATDAWKAHATPGNLISDELPTLPNVLTITPVIEKWVQSGVPLGLYFVSTDESLNKKENKRCQTTLASLELEITYRGKQEVFPH